MDFNKLLIKIDNKTYGAYDIELEPGCYGYEAKLGSRIVNGSVNVGENEKTVLHLHLPVKQSFLIGVGSQPCYSPCYQYIAYNKGGSINIYDCNKKRTEKTKLIEGQNFIIRGWTDDNKIVLSNITDETTWVFAVDNGKPDKIEKISEKCVTWSRNLKYSSFNSDTSDGILIETDNVLPSKSNIILPDKLVVSAISSNGLVAYTKTLSSNPNENQMVGVPEKTSLFLFDIEKEVSLNIAKDRFIIKDLVDFSSYGRYLCYVEFCKNSNSTNLRVYDVKKNSITDFNDCGIGWDWHPTDEKLLWVKEHNKIMSSSINSGEQLLLYEADNGVTRVCFLEDDGIAFIEEGQLYTLDLQANKIMHIDNDVHYMNPVTDQQKLVYISDYKGAC